MKKAQRKINKTLGALRVVIYARVSTGRQADKEFSSVKSQVAVCRRYVAGMSKTEPWVVSGVIEDAKTAKNDNRPGYQKLISMIQSGDFDIVLAYRNSRLNRNLEDATSLKRIARENGVRIVYVAEPSEGDTAAQRMLGNMLSTIAAFESDQIGENVAYKIEELAKIGRTHGGTPPYGYIYKDKILTPHPESSLQVKEVFARAAKGETPSQISQAFERQGWLSVSRSPDAKPVKIRADHIKRWIQNPIYKGIIYHAQSHKCYDGVHEALISKEIWKAANDGLEKNSTP